MSRLGVWALLIAAAMVVESVSHAATGSASLGTSVTGYPAGDRTDSSIDLQLQGETGGMVGAAGSLSTRFFLTGSHALAVELPELHAKATLESDEARATLALGRRLERWSRLDETWELGLWQPRFRWDYLHPMTVGLTGFFAVIETGRFRVTAFASLLHVPERGANVVEDQGGLRSDSPWFVPPVREAEVQGVATRVNYSIDEPQLRDILIHASGALRVEAGGKTGPWISAGYARKPMNQLAFGASGFYSLGLSTIEGTIHPRVLDHDLVSVEGGYSTSSLSAWLALLYERPVREGAPSDWTTQEFEIARAVSPGVKVALARETEISLSYLYVSGGNAPDHAGAIAAKSGSESVFDNRYPFKSALKARGSTRIPGPWKRGLRGETGVLVDAGRAGAEPGGGLIWTTVLSYGGENGRGHGMQATLGADVLFADGTTAADDFISRNRSNHQIRAGVSYAF